MEFRVEFDLNIWAKGLIVECSNSGEIADTVYAMTLQEMIDNGMRVKDLNIENLEYKLIYQTLQVAISDIKYKNTMGLDLPTAMTKTIILREKDNNIKENIVDEILAEIGWGHNIEVESFDYKVLARW